MTFGWPEVQHCYPYQSAHTPCLKDTENIKPEHTPVKLDQELADSGLQSMNNILVTSELRPPVK